MNRFDHHWQKLTALARQAPDEHDTGAPLGFATRVAARAATLQPEGPWAVFGRFALRGLVVEATFGLAALALDYSLPSSSAHSDDYEYTDTVGDMLNFS